MEYEKGKRKTEDTGSGISISNPHVFFSVKRKMDVSETTLWRYLEELKEKEIIKKTIIDGNIKWKLNFDNKTKNTLNQFLED